MVQLGTVRNDPDEVFLVWRVAVAFCSCFHCDLKAASVSFPFVGGTGNGKRGTQINKWRLIIT